MEKRRKRPMRDNAARSIWLGATAEELARGMTLAPPSTFEATRSADVRLRLLPSAARPLKDRARVHFHSYSMETVAEIVLGEAKQIAVGEPR